MNIITAKRNSLIKEDYCGSFLNYLRKS